MPVTRKYKILFMEMSVFEIPEIFSLQRELDLTLHFCFYAAEWGYVERCLRKYCFETSFHNIFSLKKIRF